MENFPLLVLAKLSAKLSTIHSNPLVTILRAKPSVWKALLTMLRPLDIISLARATTFCIRPTVKERQIFMTPWRQVFCHTRWTEPAGREVMVIGNDLAQLQEAIRLWSYFDGSEMKLLVLERKRYRR
jgi:hypothetical protein